MTDFASNQVIILEKTTGREIARLGKKTQEQKQNEPLIRLQDGEFSLISDLALDRVKRLDL